MALGLATEDDDGASFTQKKEATQEDAVKWTFGFGKYKDRKMLDILQEDEQYVQWFINNKASEYDKKCYELLSGEKLPTEEEQDERIKLIQEINELERKLEVDHEEVLSRLGVDSLNVLTNTQLIECINNLKKVQK